MSSVYAEGVSMGRALYPTEDRGLRVHGGGRERVSQFQFQFQFQFRFQFQF